MTSVPKSLFTPLKIGDLIVKNRIFMAPMGRNRSKDTYLNELMAEYYTQRAGSGLIVAEATLINALGTQWVNSPGIWEEKHISGWKTITDRVHSKGGQIFAQLWHPGRIAHPDALPSAAGLPIYGPSAIPARGGKYRSVDGSPGNIVPVPHPNPWELVQQYKQGAVNAKKAGIDGIEVHAANGYLVHQFLDSTSNDRTDEWGGSIEKRSKFGLEVVKALKEVYGRNVAIKLSPCGGLNDIGMPLQETLDTFSYFISELDKLDIAYICLAQYLDVFDVAYDGILRATQHDVIESYRPYIKNTPLVLNGGVSVDQGKALLASNKIDAISIGRQYINHPDLAQRVQHGKPLDNAFYAEYMFGKTDSTEEEWKTGYTDYPFAT